MTSIGRVFSYSVAVLSMAAAAEAGTKSFYIDNGDLQTIFNGTYNEGGFALIGVPDGPAGAGFTFRVPRDYKAGTAITIRLTMISFETGCTIKLDPLATMRMREGKAFSFQASVNSGLTAATTNTITTPATASQAFGISYLLRRATSGPILDQKANDVIFVGFQRDSSDTCTQILSVTGAKVTYRTR